jgi:hypothetical protein
MTTLPEITRRLQPELKSFELAASLAGVPESVLPELAVLASKLARRAYEAGQSDLEAHRAETEEMLRPFAPNVA